MRRFLPLLVWLAVILAPSMSRAEMLDFPVVKLQALDKSTARTVTFEAKVGSTIEYGSLFIKIQACRKSEPLDPPESAAFLQIWEVPLHADKSEWVFSGWMFASSPALSAMDHAVYDVWVLDCLDKTKKPAQVTEDKKGEESGDQEDLEPAKKETEQTQVEESNADNVEEVEDSEADTVAAPSEAESVSDEAEQSDAVQAEDPLNSVINNPENFE